MLEMTVWERVEHEVAEIVAARPAEYDAPTRRNLVVLLDYIRASGRPAPNVDAGYWPTFNLSWAEPGRRVTMAIEVFGSRYEIYRFYDGRTDVVDEDYDGQGALPVGLIEALPAPSKADPEAKTG